MSNAIDTLVNNRRTYSTADNPASTPFNPQKSEDIRGLLALGQDVAAALSGLLRFQNEFVPAATNDTGAGYPTTGSGDGGAIQKNDAWIIKTGGYLIDMAVSAGDLIWAKVDAATQSADDWSWVESSAAGAAIAAFGVRLDTVETRLAAAWLDLGEFTPSLDAGSGDGFPTFGSGDGGSVKANNLFRASADGYVNGESIAAGQTIVAKIDDPGQVVSNWLFNPALLGYAAENVANKTNAINRDAPSDTKYPSESGVSDALDAERDATAELTNKTISGLSNTITDLVLSMFASGVIDTDGTLAANSDSKLAPQKAVKTYVEARIAALVDSSPSTLDTLNELAAALGDDPNFAATVAASIGANTTAISDEVSRATAAEALRELLANKISSYSGTVTTDQYANAVLTKDTDNRVASIEKTYKTAFFTPDIYGDRRIWGAGSDADGYDPLWTDSAGRVRFARAGSDAIAAVNGLTKLFTFGLGPVIVDVDGYGFEISPEIPASSQWAYSIESYPTRDVVVSNASYSARLTYNEGDNSAPVTSISGVSWANLTNNVASRRNVDFTTDYTGNLNTSVTQLIHLIGYGQSLSNGRNGGTDPDGILDAGFTVMFSGGVVPGNSGGLTTAITDSDLSTLVSLQSGANATIFPRASLALKTAVASTDAVLASTHGVNGQGYTSLEKGTVPYANALRAAVRGRMMAWLGGMSHKIAAMPVIHGEADRSKTKSVYLGYLNQWQSDFESDLRKIVFDDAANIPFVMSQMSSWTAYDDIERSEVPLAQLQACLDNPDKFLMVGPKYHLPYDDDPSPTGGQGIHLTGVGYRKHGEEYGRVLAALYNGGGWDGAYTPLYVSSAVRSGTTVTCTTTGGVGNLTLDTVRISDPGNYGVTYRDGAGNPVAVSSVTITGSNTFTFELASAVAGVAEFGMRETIGNYAGPVTGPRTCFRDSATDVSAVDGDHLYNWMCHWEVTVS